MYREYETDRVPKRAAASYGVGVFDHNLSRAVGNGVPVPADMNADTQRVMAGAADGTVAVTFPRYAPLGKRIGAKAAAGRALREDPDVCWDDRKRAALALSALGTERGVAIFCLLSSRSPARLSLAVIANELNLTVRETGSDLARLRRAGLVSQIGAGRRRSFCANRFQAQECLELIHELARALYTA